MLYVILAVFAAALVLGSPTDLHKSFPNLAELQNPLAVTSGAEDKIHKILECAKKILRNGAEELGIPSVDPLEIDDIVLDFDRLGIEDVSGKVRLRDLKIEGLTNFWAYYLKAKFSMFPIGVKLELTVLFPYSSLKGAYSGNVTIGEENFAGEGNVACTMKNLLIPIKLHAVLQQNRQIKLKSLSVLPSIGSITFNMDNVEVNGEESGELVNNAVEAFPRWLKANVQEIDGRLSKIIMDFVNNIQQGSEVGRVVNVWKILQQHCI